MVSRDTKETALLVVIAMVGFLVASALNAPDAVAFAVLVSVGVLAPLVRDEWRRRQQA
jgi:Na+-translocating ferredoxin:NAD+ oxidoreductase RnfD subunit